MPSRNHPREKPHDEAAEHKGAPAGLGGASPNGEKNSRLSAPDRVNKGVSTLALEHGILAQLRHRWRA